MTSGALRPDGAPLQLEDVVVVSPGLRGTATLTRPRPEDDEARSPEIVGHDDLRVALDAADMTELLTLDITDAREVPDQVGLTTRSLATGEPALEVEVPDPAHTYQVMMAVDELGVVSWIVGEAVPNPSDAGGAGTRRYLVTRSVTAPPPEDTGERGILGAIGRKILKVIAFKVLHEAGKALGSNLISDFETARRPHRLRRFTPAHCREDGAELLTADELAAFGGEPALLLVHGTNSQSHTGLGGIPAATLQQLHNLYGGRVFAFDHPTLSVEPTVNAMWLAQHLPPGVDFTLDIICHSRGGLVSRLLAERPVMLGLDAERLAVRQLIMVATPNAGTPLAKPAHVLKFVDVITTILNAVPDNPVTSILENLLPLVKEVAVGVLDGFPGLVAMQEDGPWLSALNSPTGRECEAERLRVIVSDFEPIAGTPLGRVALDLAADVLFNGRDNDLVVPTHGAWDYPGAPAFDADAKLVLQSSKGVDHSNYWWTNEVGTQLVSWLSR